MYWHIKQLALAVISTLLVTTSCSLPVSDDNSEYQNKPAPIRLHSRTIPLSSGIEPELAKALEQKKETSLHVLLQLKSPLTPAEHKQLRDEGVELQRYLGGNSYIASIKPGTVLKGKLTNSVLHWAGQIRKADKISKDLSMKQYEDWALDSKTGNIKLLIETYSDVNKNALIKKLEKMGFTAKSYGSNNIIMQANADAIDKLAELEDVKRIQQGPIPFQPLNERGRRLTETDQAQWAELNNPQPNYRGVNGAGVRIGICDTGIDSNHDDFDTITAAGAAGVSRVYNQRAGSGSHGTHVASICGGNGLNSANNGWPAFSLRGHAPQAELGDYPSFGDNADSFHDAIVNDGTDVTNHSYVQSYTVYDTEAADLDSIVRGDATSSTGNAIPAAPQVWAAGNNGFSAQYGNEEGYYAVFTSAKNTISVGSTDTLDERISDFSSLGPTFDGRIKPDVMAPGCLDSIGTIGRIQAADNDTQGYTGMCGTSMAAPVVAGIVGLMMDAYENQFGVFPNLYPSTYKAMLVQTARDMIKTAAFTDREFNNPDTTTSLRFHAGPDFATGYGLVDANAATQLIAKGNHWRESTHSTTGSTHTYCVAVPEGASEFKVTLAWDDEPGDTTTAETRAKLVNDLDLTLVNPSNHTVYPWTINALPLTATPGDGAQDPIAAGDVNPAYRAADHRNNVEMSNVFLPAQGQWKIKVRAHNLPTGNAQNYSLVSSYPISRFCLKPPPICKLYPWICRGIPEIDFHVIDDFWVINPNTPQPIDEICKYVLNCPGCEGSSWQYCPGWDMNIGNVPPDVNISIVNQNGNIIFNDTSQQQTRKLVIDKMLPGDDHYIIFTDKQNNAYNKEIKLKLDRDIQQNPMRPIR